MSIFHDAKKADTNGACFAILDAFPLSRGHTLVCPYREIKTTDELTDVELVDLWSLVERAKIRLRSTSQDIIGFRIMINEGAPAHVDHLHVHVIPWYEGMKP